MGSTEDEEDVFSAGSGLGTTCGGLGGCVGSGTAVEVTSVDCDSGSEVRSDESDEVADRMVCVIVSVIGCSWVAVIVNGA